MSGFFSSGIGLGLATLKKLLETKNPEDRFTQSETSPLPLFQQILFRIYSLLLPFVVVPQGCLLLWSGYIKLAILHFVMTPPLVIHAFLLVKRNRGLLGPITTLSLACFLFLAVFSSGFYYVLPFAFTITATIYVIMEPVRARVAYSVWLIALTAFSFPVLGLRDTACLTLAMLITALLIDISAAILRRQEEWLEQLTVRDPLTNAFNRRSLMDSLEQAIALSKRYGTPTSIVMMDIDHFKQVNDNYGHIAGDNTLKKLVATLSERLRKTDTLCRYGGEEFVIVFNGIDLGHAMQSAQSFCDLIRESELNPHCRLTISCGVAQVRPDDTESDWLHRCDTALYQAKALGRDQVVAEESDQATDTATVSET